MGKKRNRGQYIRKDTRREAKLAIQQETELKPSTHEDITGELVDFDYDYPGEGRADFGSSSDESSGHNVLCEKHGYYWSEDGCDCCAAEEDERRRTELPDHVAALMTFAVCPNCGTQYWVENGCLNCFPNNWDLEE